MTGRRGSSLPEVLVVMGILAVLAALATPAVLRAREVADRTHCCNNLRNHAAAVFAYESAANRLPPGAVFGPFEPMGVPANVSHGLYPCLLSFLGSSIAAAEYRWDLDYTADENQSIARTELGVLVCRAAPPLPPETFAADDNGVPTKWGGRCYYGPVQPTSMLVDLGWSAPDTHFVGALPANGTVKMAHVKDGASNTILIAEQGPRGAAWVSPATLAGAREVFPGGVPGGATHPSGLPVALCDGAVRVLKWTMDPRVFAALCTASGGETIVGDFESVVPRGQPASGSALPGS